MTATLRLTLGSICLGLLAACGGGGGGDGPQSNFTYQTLDSSVDQDSSIRLIGLTGNGADPSGTGTAAGTRNGRSDSLRLGSFLNDTNGRNANGVWSDSNTQVSEISNNAQLATVFNGQYDFVIPVQVEGTNLRDNSVAILGVRSRGADMPTRGSASFTGQGIVTRNTANATESFANQSAATQDMVLNANFGNRRVTVTMNDLDELSGSSDIGFDDLQISNMVIAQGSETFSGGTLRTRDNGASYEGGVAGDNEDLDARGSFFGGSSDGPVEAGGSFVLTGDDGVVFGTFIADDKN